MGRKRKIAGATLLEGDCFEELEALDADSIDAVVTDPPYGIGFNGERWDSGAIHKAAAQYGERRLTPNEAFGVWCREWGKGCLRALKPGGHMLAFSAPRTVHRLACGLEDAGFEIRDELMWLFGTGMPKSHRFAGGLSTALKPGYEPIVLARCPLQGTTKETIDVFGTAALNTDACKVNGRHPANVLLSHEPGCREGKCASGCVAEMVDAQANRSRCGSGTRAAPSRIFYCPKVSRSERDAGCEHLPLQKFDLYGTAKKPARNSHPTVKPLELMRWLVRLGCPPGGIVLDPTCGSGSTGAATLLEERRFVGIELDPFYMEIAAARIAHWAPEGTPRPRVRRGPLGKRSRR